MDRTIHSGLMFGGLLVIATALALISTTATGCAGTHKEHILSALDATGLAIAQLDNAAQIVSARELQKLKDSGDEEAYADGLEKWLKIKYVILGLNQSLAKAYRLARNGGTDPNLACIADSINELATILEYYGDPVPAHVRSVVRILNDASGGAACLA
jgi:hypothetical protein